MKYKVLPSKRFLKDVKRLKKKYANILEDIDGIVRMMEKNPGIGINNLREHRGGGSKKLSNLLILKKFSVFSVVKF